VLTASIYCNKCGAQNAAGVQFCSQCGAPFAPSPVTIPTTNQVPVGSYSSPAYASAPTRMVQYGGFWIRFLAFIIDLIVVQIIVFPVSLIFMTLAGITGAMGGADRNVLFGGVWMMAFTIRAIFGGAANWIYEAALESSARQATLGKMALGLKVTDLYANRISFARATGRHFAKYLSGFIFMIGYIMVGFTERKQALHDIIAGTLVIRT